ncbi:MAG: hypothetical protein VX246_13550 [Myxococcota bacterium]|nr:hypothetical protein [Myxococcota bacterium]
MTSPQRILGALGIAVAVAIPWFLTGNFDAPGSNSIFGRWAPPVFVTNVTVGLVGAFALRTLLLGEGRRRGFEALLVVVSVGFVVGILEAAAALGLDYQDIVGLPEHKRLTRIKPWDNPSNLRDETLIFRHRPNVAFAGEVQGDLVALYGIATDRSYSLDVRYDANGHRNPEPSEAYEIVLIGDSFIEADLTPPDQLQSVHLRRLTGKKVLNLGVAGYGPQQELELLRRHATQVEAERIVWFFFEGNDLLDVDRYLFYERFPESYMNPEATFSERSFVNNLMAALSSWTEPRRRVDAQAARERRCAYPQSQTSEHRELYFAYSGAELRSADLEHLAEVEKILATARTVARDAGAELQLVFVPTKFRVFDGICEVPEGSLLLGWKTNDLPARLGHVAERLGVPYLDLTPGLRAAAGAGESAYFPDDGHWNANGQRLVAELLAEELEDVLRDTSTP